jgi:nucleoprotein TPR
MEAAAHVNEIQSRLDEDIENAVKEVREANQEKIEQLEQRLRTAEEAKRRIEEDILNKSTPLRRRRRIEGGERPLAITAGGNGGDVSMLEDDGPLSLTDLYTRLAETEDDLRAEQHENKKLKILIERIHRDVAAKTPIFHQKQLELESALEELDEMKERLDYARREITDTRSDNQDLEAKKQQMEREVNGLKRENVELASQVQSLLQRRAAESGDVITFCDIQTIQSQNQELVRQHNSMREKIQELESQDDKIELDQLRTEIVTLREEREKQANLVAGIVHQRDLYRALVAKNDASGIDGADQLTFADARAEQLPLIEARNRDLTEEVTKLRADVSSFNREKEALEGRLKCLESINNDLTGSNHRLNGDLVAARAEAARSKIDAKHYQDRCDRLAVSLEDIKSEMDSLSVGKKRAEELYTQTQTNLDVARSELAKKEQAYRDATSRLNRLDTDLETYRNAEHRFKADLESLRNENARLGTLLTSVQRIEASLSAKSEGEIEHLNEEVKRLRESKMDDDTKHTETLQKLDGKIVELELSVKDLASQKDSAVVAANKANLEVSKLNFNIQQLNLKLKASEKELSAAKAKLGDVTIDTSAEEALESRVAELTMELDSKTADLAKATERLDDYQQIAKSTEEQLAELTAASKKYKEETTATLDKLKKSEQGQKEAVAELTKDLMAHRGEKEKAEAELKAQIDSLTVQLTSAKEDATKAITRMDSLASEIKRYQMDAKNAQTNYERELALHAEARSSMRDIRSELASEQSRRETAETQLLSVQKDFETEKAAWDEAKIKLEQSVQEGKIRVDDLRSQNNLLHDQMTTLTATVEKIQSEKASQVSGEVHAGGNDKQLSDLRELLRFKQSECTMLEADLSSAKRASERERTSAELAKKSLEEARSELKIVRESNKAGSDDSKSALEMDDLRSKLKSAEEQLVLLRESNAALREQLTKMSKELKEVQLKLSSANAAVTPSKEKIRSMEVEKASLEAEKESLSREAEAWKNRVSSLVSKFNQIDPTEHAQALESIERLKGECASLNSLREKAVSESTNAKGIVTKLNKEIASQKASIEVFRTALEKAKKEKEELVVSSQASKATNKKIVEAQNAAKKAEEETKKAQEEVTALNARVDNFKKMMLKMQKGLKDAKEAEVKSKAAEESLQKEIASLKVQLSTAEKSSGGDNDEVQSTATNNTATDSRSGISKLVSKVIHTKKSKANANAAAVKDDAQKDAEVTVQMKKKGKKRKANVPKENAAAALAEGSDAPPQKKFAAAGGKEEAAKGETTTATPADKSGEVKGSEVVNITDEKTTETQNKADGDAEMVSKEDEAAAKQKADEEVALKAKTEAAAKQKAEEEGAAKKAKMEAVAKQKEGGGAAKQKAEEEAAAKREILAQRKKANEESIAKLKAEQEAAAKKVKEEEADKRKEENETSEAASEKSEQTAADSKQEELMKKRMLLKKKKAELEAAQKKMLEATQAKAAKESGDTDTDATTSTPKSTLSPVLEEKQSVSKPIAFGTSATTTPQLAFGVPKTTPLQSEPDCPKPSFLGSSASAKPTFGGLSTASSTFAGVSASTSVTPTFGGVTTSASTKPTFGGVATSTTPSIFGGGSSETKPATTIAGGGSFLNLTPPGQGGATPGKFVFGKSANITLTAPSGASPAAAAMTNPFASFGQPAKLGSSPFGAPFGTIPFGGGDATKKRSLDSAPDEPDAKKPNTEDDDAKRLSTTADGAAKEA